MTPSRWREVKEIAADVLELPVQEQASYVRRVCAGDAVLKEEVERLVAAGDGDATGPLDRPPAVIWREERSLSPDMLLSARFRIRAFLAKGGMGEVYSAHDERMGEDVALKIISREIADRPGMVDRFRHEVQRARRITHPNVCRIHDLYFHAGADGATQQFLTMQLIAGPTLAAWKRDPERAQVSESLPLLMDLVSGLQAAHEAGIAHSDLKPGNVLVDQAEGRGPRAVITDFGLARALRNDAGHDTTHTNIVGGSPAYMAPELRLGSGGSVAGDIYAFGVIAYELLTGVHPFDGKPVWEKGPDWQLTPPRVLVSQIPPVWEAAILRCLDPEPGARFASVAALRSAVLDEAERAPANSGKAGRRIPRRLLIAGAMVVVALVAGWRTATHWPRSGALPGSAAAISARHVLVADIDNRTGQALLDHTVRELVTAMLEQSPVVKIFPAAQLPAALRLMGRSETTDLTIPLALEICQREGLEGVVTGSVTRVGSEYLIILKVLDSQGETISSASASARSLDQVIHAAEDASRALRTNLGETGASIRKSKPLERVTSPSLQAVQYFSLGKIQLNNGDPEGAANLFQRAIQMDPRFAMAHGYLGNTFGHLGNMPASRKELATAVQMSDRVTEPERLKILGDYNMAIVDFPESARFYELLIHLTPDSAPAHLNLGQAYLGEFHFDRALTETDAAIRLDPEAGFQNNAAEILMEAGRCEEARARAERVITASEVNSRSSYIIARCDLAAGEVDRANSRFEQICGSQLDYQARACAAIADIALAHRRTLEAVSAFRRAMVADRTNRNEYGVVLRRLALQAIDPQTSGTSTGDSLDLKPVSNDDRLLVLSARLFGASGNAAALQQIVGILRQRRTAHGTPTIQSFLDIAESTLAAVEKRPDDALRFARLAVQDENSSFAVDVLAEAYAAAGMNREAVAEFEKVVARSNERMESYDEPAWHRLRDVHEKLAALYGLLGDSGKRQEQMVEVSHFMK